MSDVGAGDYKAANCDGGMEMRMLMVLCVALGCAACGEGTSSFYPSFRPYDVPNSIAIGDLDQNLAPDIVLAVTHVDGSYPNAGFASILFHNGLGFDSFQPALDMAAGFNPSAVAVADLGGVSNTPPIIVANSRSANISIFSPLLGAPLGTYHPAFNIDTGGVPYDVVVGDVDYDGLKDIAVADGSDQGGVIVIYQDMRGHFLPATRLEIGRRTTSVAIGDVNDDAMPDVVAVSVDSNGVGTLSIFFSGSIPATRGFFLPRVDLPAGTQPTSVKIDDIYIDGPFGFHGNDIVFTNYGPSRDGAGSSGVSVLTQDPTLPGAFLPMVRWATAPGSVNVAIGDLNKDGHPDLVVANTGGSSTGTISVLLQDASRPATFLAATNYRGVYEPVGVAIAQLNGDLLPDIAVADGNRAAVMFSTPANPGTFSAPRVVGQ